MAGERSSGIVEEEEERCGDARRALKFTVQQPHGCHCQFTVNNRPTE